MKVYITIPTYNGGDIWKKSCESIVKNAPTGTFVQVIDSNSTDDTRDVAIAHGFNVHKIDTSEFNHGGTRNLAVEMHKAQYDIVIFMTQDAIPEQGFVENILGAFENEKVACAYGRQLPHLDATPISQHARLFNYGNEDYYASINDIDNKGIKTVFSSNSFAAYRITTFLELGGFPKDTILSEDMYLAAKAVLAGYQNAYVAKAMVRHSHNYSFLEEFRRYFDIGVFHANEPWIRNTFGGAGGEGRRFILSELVYLWNNNVLLIPKSLLCNASKISGYKLGQNYKKISEDIRPKLSMHRRYWKNAK
ncbi:TPA: glycosyltransferase family 2 protein [Raoultella ornithinolytica]|uniref:Glycosyl transferase n=1 Tax=Klebsiella sp. 7730 TaxID=1497819 RepID=A0A0P0YRI1_9ENTR|nr:MULTISPECIES: glycosyltransferase [Raoultella]BAT23819.1 glycosyl transferase [Klebsiella sp. 7730]VTN55169.1 Predicted glycosyl hydrolase [Raoultella ornithinolytica]HED1778820.1 glycosyltransferase family 2 protein [Raoultella ornithinolytica]